MTERRGSRLDSFIRRLEAQQACLEMAVGLIADLPGPVLEFGLVGQTMHQIDERVETKDLVELADIYQAILDRTFQS